VCSRSNVSTSIANPTLTVRWRFTLFGCGTSSGGLPSWAECCSSPASVPEHPTDRPVPDDLARWSLDATAYGPAQEEPAARRRGRGHARGGRLASPTRSAEPSSGSASTPQASIPTAAAARVTGRPGSHRVRQSSHERAHVRAAGRTAVQLRWGFTSRRHTAVPPLYGVLRYERRHRYGLMLTEDRSAWRPIRSDPEGRLPVRGELPRRRFPARPPRLAHLVLLTPSALANVLRLLRRTGCRCSCQQAEDRSGASEP
jgi:hypothetical protein